MTATKRDQTHRDQPSLFDQIIDDAIQRADENADDQWKRLATDCLSFLANTQAEITADDVYLRMQKNHPHAITHNKSALGAIFKRAARDKLIRKTGRMRQTQIPIRHRSITVWESLVYGRGNGS